MFTIRALERPRRANSSAPMECRVASVRGTATRRTSRPWERKLWRDALSVPENQADGILPSGSPVPGTIYPASFRDSGVLRGDAV